MRADLTNTVTEAGLQQAVIDLAQLHGWLCYHTHDSRRSAPGFPDLVLCHPGNGALNTGQLLFAELKTVKGKTTVGQQMWLRALRLAGVEAYLWRPDDWPAIVERLKQRASQ